MGPLGQEDPAQQLHANREHSFIPHSWTELLASPGGIQSAEMKSTDLCPKESIIHQRSQTGTGMFPVTQKGVPCRKTCLTILCHRRESQFPAEGIQEGFLGEVALELGFSMLDIWNNGEGSLGGGARRWVLYMEPRILLLGWDNVSSPFFLLFPSEPF